METMWLRPRKPKRIEISLASVPMVRGGDGVHAALLHVAGVIETVLLLGELLAAAAGADDHADAAQFLARHGGRLQAGIAQRFFHRGDAQRHGAGNVRTVLGRHVAILVEIHHLARHLHGMRRRDRSG